MIVLSQGAGLGSLMAAYLAQAYSGRTLIRDRWDRLRFLIENVSTWCKRALGLLHIEVEVSGLERLDLKNKNYLFAGNHMSYLDILVFSSRVPSVFVTSVDMGEVFLLGTLAELGGSIFIERRNRSQVDRDLGNLTDTLRNGFNVVIYPEGTSTNGQRILPFKKTLFMSAVESGREIVPVALKYMEIDGEPFSVRNADRVCWYGDMGFADHFLGILKFKKVKARLEFQTPISTKPEGYPQPSRTEIAEAAWSVVQKAYFSGRPSGFGEPREQMKL